MDPATRFHELLAEHGFEKAKEIYAAECMAGQIGRREEPEEEDVMETVMQTVRDRYEEEASWYKRDKSFGKNNLKEINRNELSYYREQHHVKLDCYEPWLKFRYPGATSICMAFGWSKSGKCLFSHSNDGIYRTSLFDYPHLFDSESVGIGSDKLSLRRVKNKFPDFSYLTVCGSLNAKNRYGTHLNRDHFDSFFVKYIDAEERKKVQLYTCEQFYPDTELLVMGVVYYDEDEDSFYWSTLEEPHSTGVPVDMGIESSTLFRTDVKVVADKFRKYSYITNDSVYLNTLARLRVLEENRLNYTNQLNDIQQEAEDYVSSLL